MQPEFRDIDVLRRSCLQIAIHASELQRLSRRDELNGKEIYLRRQ